MKKPQFPPFYQRALRHRSVAGLVLLIPLTLSFSKADDLPLALEAPSSPKLSVKPVSALPTTEEETVFNLKFSGGNSKDLVQALAEQCDLHLNVIVPARFAEAPITPFNLKRVTLLDLFLAIEAADGLFFKRSRTEQRQDRAIWVLTESTESKRETPSLRPGETNGRKGTKEAALNPLFPTTSEIRREEVRKSIPLFVG
ncbi:MAG: hypothetical protein AAF514_16740, partial [Verrucomicrobiota bacterium]